MSFIAMSDKNRDSHIRLVGGSLFLRTEQGVVVLTVSEYDDGSGESNTAYGTPQQMRVAASAFLRAANDAEADREYVDVLVCPYCNDPLNIHRMVEQDYACPSQEHGEPTLDAEEVLAIAEGRWAQYKKDNP